MPTISDVDLSKFFGAPSPLESIIIPTNPEELADMLDTYARDWGEVLVFLNNVAKSQGIELDTVRVSESIVKGYGELYE